MIRFLSGAIVGALLLALVPVAHADTANEIYRIRAALESIAHSMERCSK